MWVKKYCLINAKVIYFKKVAARESLKDGGKTLQEFPEGGYKPVYAQNNTIQQEHHIRNLKYSLV